MKLLPLAILAVLLTGCRFVNKKPPLVATPHSFDAAPVTLQNTTSDIAKTTDDLQAVENDMDAASSDAAVGPSSMVDTSGPFPVAKVIEWKTRIAEFIANYRSAAAKLASVNQQVTAMQARLAAVEKENAALKDTTAQGLAKGLHVLVFACIAVFVVGVFFFVYLPLDKKPGLALMAAGGAGAAAGMLYAQTVQIWFWIGVGLAAIFLGTVLYVVIKTVRDRNAKAKIANQTVTGAKIVTSTLQSIDPALAALATMQLKGAQDHDVSQAVDGIIAKIDPDMVKREVAKAAVVSALPAMTQATLATPIIPPSPLPPPSLSGLVGGEQSVTVAPQTVTGTMVDGSGSG